MNDSSGLQRLLQQNGYAYLPKWYPEATTIEIGRSLGTVTDIELLLPQTRMPTVQVLRPTHKDHSSSNRYSGTYGLGEFPLHSDLAYWVIPPRYVILRCHNGSESVVTRILDCSLIESMVDTATLRRALVRPRRSGPTGTLALLSVMFRGESTWGLRWDPLFLVPMNSAAVRFAGVVETHASERSGSGVISLSLVDHGDTLVLDNWRVFHGRSSVSTTHINRRIERIYLSAMHT